MQGRISGTGHRRLSRRSATWTEITSNSPGISWNAATIPASPPTTKPSSARSAQFVIERKISRDGFEFQMLYGIRRDLQRRLVAEGYRLRLYVPFGKAWYPYYMRRLAERPANVFFMLRNLFRS